MEIQPTIEVNLEEYGGQPETKVVLSAPPFRRLNNMRNAARRCLSGMKVDRNNPPRIEDIAFGDMEIIALMAYIKSAPFEPTLDGFLDYCDGIDAVKVGNGEALYNRLTKEADRIKSGELSPLPN